MGIAPVSPAEKAELRHDGAKGRPAQDRQPEGFAGSRLRVTKEDQLSDGR